MTGYEAKVERLNTEFSLDKISDIVNEKMEELVLAGKCEELKALVDGYIEFRKNVEEKLDLMVELAEIIEKPEACMKKLMAVEKAIAQIKAQVGSYIDAFIDEFDVNNFEVGDIISFELEDGEEVEAMAVKQDGDNMIFCFVDCLLKEYRMNPTNTNEGGWETSDLRQKLNSEILERFPEKIKNRMVPFENGDILRIPTEKEMFGENEHGKAEPEDVDQWEPMKTRRNRVCFQGKNGFGEWGWLQNAVSSAHFANVGCHGGANYYWASDSLGVRPVFQLPIRNQHP